MWERPYHPHDATYDQSATTDIDPDINGIIGEEDYVAPSHTVGQWHHMVLSDHPSVVCRAVVALC